MLTARNKVSVTIAIGLMVGLYWGWLAPIFSGNDRFSFLYAARGSERHTAKT